MLLSVLQSEKLFLPFNLMAKFFLGRHICQVFSSIELLIPVQNGIVGDILIGVGTE